MQLEGKRILAFVENDFEDLELWYPVLRLREAGAEVVVAGAEKHKIYTGKYGVPIEADVSFNEVESAAFAGLYVPGGWAPDKLRTGN